MLRMITRKNHPHPLLLLLPQLLLLILHNSSCAFAFVPGTVSTRTKALFHTSPSESSEFGNLSLNASDLAMFQQMHSRIMTLPVLIVQGSTSVLLPGEKFEFSSADPRFETMIQRVLEQSSNTSNAASGSSKNKNCIGIIGTHPLHPNQALSLGVTVPIAPDSITYSTTTNGNDKERALCIKGVVARQRFEVQGEPWLDEESEAFYWCHADVTERQEMLDRMSEEDAKRLKYLAGKIPGLVQQWLDLMVKYDIADFAMLRKIYKTIGPMPKSEDYFKTANWVAALINNAMLQEVCMDIRAAMLACRNNLDRVNLAVAAIENSIRYLKTAY